MSKDKSKYKKLYSTIGQNIKKFRISKGLSQEQLAFEIDSTRNYIGCIERGEKHPSIAIVYEISKALEINLEDIFKAGN